MRPQFAPRHINSLHAARQLLRRSVQKAFVDVAIFSVWLRDQKALRRVAVV
jgi:hypothetical protein